MSGPSTFKNGIALSASLTIIALAISGCSLTDKKPEIAATTITAPRPASAAEAMQQATIAKQQRQAKNAATGYVDPLVSARPSQNQTGQNQPSQHQNDGSQNVRDFRASGRSAIAAMRSGTTAPAGTARAPRPALPPAPAPAAGVPEISESAMAGIVTQPTGIQAGRNSIFSGSAAPAADIGTADNTASTSHVSSATGSLSTDAVAYAPVRRISGTSGGLFAGGPQMAANSDAGGRSSSAAANHAPPGIATRPSVPSAAEPVAQGLW